MTLTLWQRINLQMLVRQHKPGDPTRMLDLLDALRKFRLKDSEIDGYMGKPCGACGQGRIWNRSLINSAPDAEISFTPAEARQLRDIVTAYVTEKKATVDDGEWLLPLKDALAEVAKQ